MTQSDLDAVVTALAETPDSGVLIPGTGGARKFRLARIGGGKSGGYRIISYYCAADVPVFLLDVYSKGDKANLTHAERNALRSLLSGLADDWRSGVKNRRLRNDRRRI